MASRSAGAATGTGKIDCKEEEEELLQFAKQMRMLSLLLKLQDQVEVSEKQNHSMVGEKTCYNSDSINNLINREEDLGKMIKDEYGKEMIKKSSGEANLRELKMEMMVKFSREKLKYLMKGALYNNMAENEAYTINSEYMEEESKDKKKMKRSFEEEDESQHSETARSGLRTF